jgi:hypothetical protein
MTKKQKKIVDYIIMCMFFLLFWPFILIHVIACGILSCTKYLFENILNPIYNKLCKFIRGPIPNSTVQVKGPNDNFFKRVNDKLLTIKEAKQLGKEYESKGYEVSLHLSEF